MSRQLIDRSADLRRLRDEGFEIEVRSGLLLVHAVPYVTSRREVTLGILVSELTMAAPDQLDKPGTHQIHFIGEHPCKPDGTELVNIAQPTLEGRNLKNEKDLNGKLFVQEYLKAATPNGAWTEYTWYKPGEDTPGTKRVFVKKVQAGGQTYILGAGYFPVKANKNQL